MSPENFDGPWIHHFSLETSLETVSPSGFELLERAEFKRENFFSADIEELACGGEDKVVGAHLTSPLRARVCVLARAFPHPPTRAVVAGADARGTGAACDARVGRGVVAVGMAEPMVVRRTTIGLGIHINVDKYPAVVPLLTMTAQRWVDAAERSGGRERECVLR
ncbi:hypothetical protein B0H10DRAFT_1970827 [Mycena sp. CBHHK59/15]|nr:hypothetical protein B0H10DRAFT_1970827 [Mycena sp. CBHHK59/15]